MIKYLLLDLDNTLYSCRYGLEDNVSRRIREYTAALLGCSPEEAWQRRKERISQYGTTLEWLRAEKGFTNVDDYLAAVHPQDEAENLPPDPELRAFLESIPIPKAILTNSPCEHADRILDKLGIGDLFTHIFDIRLNNFVGKPNAQAFYRALEAISAKPEEVLFIDDYPRYVSGFIDIGGQGLLLDEDDVHSHYPYGKIRNLRELAEYL
jgi:putative hydrolase of the HAD superfamily